MTELLGATYSPWTEKARWALDARKIPHTFRRYTPLLGEPALRWKLKRFSGPVSVPVLTDDGGRAIADSATIARWADGHGEGPVMFPPGQEAAVDRFVALSERGLDAGRAVSLVRVLADDEAVRELVPRGLRRLPLASGLGAYGVRRTLRKYGAGRRETAAHAAVLTEVLDELRAALDASPPLKGGPRVLLGQLSFADIAMAQVIAYVEPPEQLRLGAASRRCYGDPVLAARYQDLVSWRNALYAAHRASPEGSVARP